MAVTGGDTAGLVEWALVLEIPRAAYATIDTDANALIDVGDVDLTDLDAIDYTVSVTISRQQPVVA